MSSRLVSADEPRLSDEALVWAQRVVESAGQIEDKQQKIIAQADLARVYRWMGQALKSREAAIALGPSGREGLQIAACRHATIALKEAGLDDEMDEVIALAEAANSRGHLSYGLMDIYLHADRIDLALRFAAEDKGNSRYRQLATLLCTQQKIDTALELVNEHIKSSDDRDNLFVEMVQVCVQSEHSESAIPILDQIESRQLVHRAQDLLSSSQESEQSLAARVVIYSKMTDRQVKTDTALPLAKALIDEGRLKQAAEILDQAVEVIENQPIGTQSSKFGTYGDLASIARLRTMNYSISKSHFDRNDKSAAEHHLRIADEAYTSLYERSLLVRWPMEFVRAYLLLHIGRLQEVEAMLDSAKDDTTRDMMASVLSAHLIKQNRIDEGMKYYQQITEDGYRRQDVAVALLEVNEQEVAAEVLNDMGDEDRNSVIQKFARAVAETRTASELETIYAGLSSPVFQCHFASTVFDELNQ
ncbi:hypothetical protein AB1L42_07940 [Thalassoglobus sp. JC818]|uniref:hypothetical protein n=1 Tax=Thalassoglobus sp. JC818 TaxID=3232136 RepID=UPI003458E4B9